MSFKSNVSPASVKPNTAWEAQGFLNLYLPSKDGTKRRKLGFIPLRNNKTGEREMLDWLNEDPTRVSALLAKLIIEYTRVEGSEASGFDLS